jgi:CubicO group peptidase (beta-lactamase class C family)
MHRASFRYRCFAGGPLRCWRLVRESISRILPGPGQGSHGTEARLTRLIKYRSTRVLLLTALLIALVYAGYEGQRLAALGSALTAKYLCSAAFVGGRDPDQVARVDLAAFRSATLGLVDWKVDTAGGATTASLFGLGRRQARYRPGLGCTVAIDRVPADVPVAQSVRSRSAAAFPPALPTPPALGKVIEAAFSEPDPGRPRRTRALLVIHRGHTLAERYAPGYSAQSRFIGWSMSKSVLSALVGILVAQGRLALGAPAPVPEWANAADPRHAITLDQLLHMSSGLAFDEDYDNPLSDVLWMLYGTGDGAGFAAGKPLAATPGTTFHYSTGTTTILSRLVARTAGEGYPRFARRTLFAPLGMESALIEPDAAGTPMGACCMWATARDWARFGLLYLNAGLWQGRRILPAEWVAYSRTPAPAAEESQYGAHFWLKVPPPFRIEPGRPQLLPADAFHAVGYGGQFITVIPSRELVVVRLGLALDPAAWDQEAFIHDLLEALSPTGP